MRMVMYRSREVAKVMAKVEKVWAITLFDMCMAMYWSQEHFWWDSEMKVMAKMAKPCTGAKRFATEGEDNSKPLSSTFGEIPRRQRSWRRVAKGGEGRPIIRDDRGYRGCIQSVWAGSKCKRAWSRWRVAPLDGLLLCLLCTLRALLSWLGSVFVAEDHFGGGRKKLRKSRDFSPIWNGFVKEAQPFTKAYPS
ncbi:hypothetical protein B0H13DRAFT_1933898 [Mycena leptocephala]|nr:hypothetical protein B0H13DRAFT_1933898 [Mycena leptocephala]